MEVQVELDDLNVQRARAQASHCLLQALDCAYCRSQTMRLQQQFAAGEMGFDDQFAILVRFGSWLFSNSGRADFAGDGCCGGWDFRALRASAFNALFFPRRLGEGRSRASRGAVRITTPYRAKP